MSIFYYYGIMQWIVGLIARVMQKTLGHLRRGDAVGGGKRLRRPDRGAAGHQAVHRDMTMSELNAVMIGGFATMAGGVLAAYVDMGIYAKHLLSASVMAAPAGLMIAKIMQPEVDEPKTLGHVESTSKDPSVNVLEAIANGHRGGLQLALNVGAMLIVFLALIALVNDLILGLESWGLRCGQSRRPRSLGEARARHGTVACWSLEGGWAGCSGRSRG